MRDFKYNQLWKNLTHADTCKQLTQIHEFKGRQDLYRESQSEEITLLEKVARIQSVESSNKIEGIFTSNERLALLMEDKTASQDRNEAEILGYRNVLNIIHESFPYVPLENRYILQLHKILTEPSDGRTGGKYKQSNNIIQETAADGTNTVRFQPVEAWQTPQAMENICTAYQQALPLAEPLLLIPIFIVDFLCIHPFSDGNGRMSRLLTLLLLYQSGYFVGKYISIEKLIESTKESYYETLQKSSQRWHEGENNYQPFVEYFLSILLIAHSQFQDRTEAIRLSPDQQLRKLLSETLGKVHLMDIKAKCPNLDESTILNVLRELESEGIIVKVVESQREFIIFKHL